MDRENFNTKLHEVCSTDELRPIMMCVHFVNGFAYAADSSICIKQSLEYHSIINPESLEGKSIHRDSYKNIMQFEKAECTEEGILCSDPDGRKAFFEYFKRDGDIPDFDKLFKGFKETKVPFIGMNPKLINRLSAAMHSIDGILRLRFQTLDKAIFIDCVGIPNQEGILMPALINDTLFT